MSVFAISDLHLSFNCDKPMDIFGNNWGQYCEKIKINWNKKIKDSDLVIVPGDISWSTYLNDCYEDFKFIDDLNGRKVILKGNHDYWWTTTNKMNKFLEENEFNSIFFLQNNSFQYESISVCGTRGWGIPTTESSELDKKIFAREKSRLVLSIEDAKKKSDNEILVALHYPPIEKGKINTDLLEIFKFYGIKKCIYGHLHSYSINNAITGDYEGIDLKLVSCDSLNFNPVCIF